MFRFLILLFLIFPIFSQDGEEETREEVLASIFQKRDSFSADQFYEDTLKKAYYAFVEKDYPRAINKLDLIVSKYKEKD